MEARPLFTSVTIVVRADCPINENKLSAKLYEVQQMRQIPSAMCAVRVLHTTLYVGPSSHPSGRWESFTYNKRKGEEQWMSNALFLDLLC